MTKKIFLRKAIKKVGLVILLLWLVFSAGYVIRDQWLRFQFKQIQTAYQKGITDSIRTIMVQSANCQQVTLQDGDKRVELIATSCLETEK